MDLTKDNSKFGCRNFGKNNFYNHSQKYDGDRKKKIAIVKKRNIKDKKISQKMERENKKEKLKNLEKLEEFLREKGAYPENLELLEYFDGGSECNTYISSISSKKNKCQKKSNNEIDFCK